MKVCWLSNYFSPYTLKQFDLISQEIELTALMLGGKDDNRNEEWVLDDKYNFKVELIDDNFSKTIKRLAKENDILIDSMYSTKYGYQAVSTFKKENKKVLMQADGGITKNRGYIINKIISYLMNRHDYFISSGEDTDNYFKYYGVNPQKIFQFRFTSLSASDIKNNKELANTKNELRKELGIDDKFTLISVGQPIERKGFDILIKAYIESGLQDHINLFIIGGKPQKEVEDLVSNNDLKNVFFKDLMKTDELNRYYAAADVFILCTREDIWGLVIQEAMSFGLPVITSDKCVCGLHFKRLGDNTIICAVDDIKAYAQAINKLYLNRNNLDYLINESFRIIQDYTLENSSKDIINILNRL